MFSERGGHEFFGREIALSGGLQLQMMHCVDPIHKFEFPSAASRVILWVDRVNREQSCGAGSAP